MNGNRATVTLYLPRDRVACLVVLRQRLTVERAGHTLTVRLPTLDAPAESLRLALCDRDGQPFDTRRLQPKTPATFELDKYPGDSPAPACLKLLDAGRLVDITAILE